MSKIENHKYTIEEAFRDCFYIIPDYQREYVWAEKEVNKLLEDINDEIDGASSSEYFIGTILTSPTLQKHHIEVIEARENPAELMRIARQSEFAHLKFPNEREVLTLQEAVSFPKKTHKVVEKNPSRNKLAVTKSP